MDDVTLGSVILPATRDDAGFVELARTQKGRLFKKQILHMNQSFVHPSDKKTKIKVDEALAMSLVENFKKGYCDIVQVPIVDGANQHNEDPLRNVGEVVDVKYDDKGVYAILDARNEAHANQLGKTLIGASALMHMNYEDTATGKKVGPTLLHVAVTNRPYITNLEDFDEMKDLVAASADSFGEDAPEVLSPADDLEDNMDLDQLLTKLKDDHGIDVAALQAQKVPGTDELVTALSNVLKEAGAPAAQGDDDGPVTLDDVANAVIELSQEKLSLSSTVEALKAEAETAKKEKAEAEVDALVRVGRVLPKSRDTMVELSMSDREKFESLLPENPIVSLSADGVTTHDEPDNATFEAAAEEVARIVALANGSK
jgi:hypothetical protein